MNDDKLQIYKTTDKSLLTNEAIEDKEDIVSLTTAFFTNLLEQIPGMALFSGTAKDYYQAKVAKKREVELKSFLKQINTRLKGIEMK